MTRLLSTLLLPIAMIRSCFSASRRADIARLGRVCLVQVERPAGRTTCDQADASGGLRCAAGGRACKLHSVMIDVRRWWCLRSTRLCEPIKVNSQPTGQILLLVPPPTLVRKCADSAQTSVDQALCIEQHRDVSSPWIKFRRTSVATEQPYLSGSAREAVESTRTTADERLPSLTGLRFVAALAVFGFHIAAQGFLENGRANETVHQIFAAGSTGVGFFFVLSGFVLTWSARSADSIRAIWRRRAARIVPNHIVAWSIAFMGLIYAGEAGSLWTDGPSLILMQSWFPSQRVYFAVNTPAWSLSCELAFYIAFPFLLPIIGRIPVPRLWSAAGLVVVGVFLVPVIALGLPDQVAYWFVWIFPGVRALEFVLGMLLARIVRAGLWIRIGLLLPTALAVAGYLAAAHVPRGFGFVAATVVPYAMLIAAVASADLANRPTPWRSAPLVLLGELSFAFYLLHQIVIRGVDQALGDRIWSSTAGLAITGVMLLASVAASWLLHKGVERPMSRMLSGRPGKRLQLATAIKHPRSGQRQVNVPATGQG